MLSRRHGRRAGYHGMEVISQGVDFIAQLFIGAGSQSAGLGQGNNRSLVWAPCLSRLSVKLSLRFGKNRAPRVVADASMTGSS